MKSEIKDIIKAFKIKNPCGYILDKRSVVEGKTEEGYFYFECCLPDRIEFIIGDSCCPTNWSSAGILKNEFWCNDNPKWLKPLFTGLLRLDVDWKFLEFEELVKKFFTEKEIEEIKQQVTSENLDEFLNSPEWTEIFYKVV